MTPTPAPAPAAPPPLLASPAAAALLRSLDTDQRAVVRWTPADGNLAVAASAGSGKSRSVVAMVAGLLIRRIVPPGRIVLATFTRAGADVFRKRLEPLIGAYATEAIYMGTWHALARQYLQGTQPWRWPDAANLSLPDNGLIVRPGGGVSPLKDPKGRPRRRDADDSGRSLRTYDLWRNILGFGSIPGLDRKGMDLKLEDQGLDVRDYMQQVGILRGHGLFPGAWAIDAGHLPRFIDAWKLYEGAKRALHAHDFDDLLVAWRSALRRTQEGDWTDDRPAPDATWEPQPFDSARGRIVIVDEGQDQSGVQLDIGRRLAGPAGRMVLVGDPRQAIFGFQGAHSKAFATGIAKMAGRLVGLPNNYRSAPRIVAAGNVLVAGQSWAIGEPARAVRTEIEGIVTVRRWGQDPEEGAEFVAQEIGRRLQGGVEDGCVEDGSAASHRASLGDFAILTRSNAEAGLYEAALLRARIPVQVLGHTGLLGGPQGRIFVAWARLVADGARDDLDGTRRKDLGLALLEAYRHPNRYLSRAWADDTAKRLLTSCGSPSLLGVLEEEIARKGTSGQQRARVQGLLRELEGLTKRAAGGDWPAAADRIGAMLLPRKPAVGARRHEDPALVLAALAQVAGTTQDAAEFLALVRGAGEAARGGGADGAGQDADAGGQGIPSGAISVGTIHQAKGREYRIVYVPMTGGMFPAPMAMRDGQEPEERRLAYVAVTRAQDEVHVGWTVRRLAAPGAKEAARGGPGTYAQELAEWLDSDDTGSADDAGSSVGGAS